MESSSDLYQPPEPNETLSVPPNYRFHENSPEKKKKPTKKKRVKLIVGDKTAKKSSSTEDVELYDILQALRAEDMIKIRGPTGPGKDTVVAALYDYCIQRTKNFRRGDIFWLPPMQGVTPKDDSLYGDLCHCLDILQDSSIVQDSPEERWDKDEMLMEYQDRIDVEMEFMKPLLIVDYSLITFVSADAQTGFERFLSHLMTLNHAKVIKLETSGTPDDPLSGQSQSTGESTNSSSEALTEIIKFLEEEDRREQLQRTKKMSGSDRSAMSSLAYSEEGSFSNLQSESGATIGSETTYDTSSLLAGTKLVGSLMEEAPRTTTASAATTNATYYNMRDDDHDDYYFTTPVGPKSKTIRSIANQHSNQATPPRQEDYASRHSARTQSFGGSHNESIPTTSASTVPAGTNASPQRHAAFAYRMQKTDSRFSQAESRAISSHSSPNMTRSETIGDAGGMPRYRTGDSQRSHYMARSRSDTHTMTRNRSNRSRESSFDRRRRRTKRQVEEDEESYFSQSSSHYESTTKFCGLDMGDANKLLRRFVCFY